MFQLLLFTGSIIAFIIGGLVVLIGIGAITGRAGGLIIMMAGGLIADFFAQIQKNRFSKSHYPALHFETLCARIQGRSILCDLIKAAGINLLRAAAVWMAINPETDGSKSAEIDWNHTFSFIKERFLIKWRDLKNIFKLMAPTRAYMFKN